MDTTSSWLRAENELSSRRLQLPHIPLVPYDVAQWSANHFMWLPHVFVVADEVVDMPFQPLNYARKLEYTPDSK